MDLDIIVFEEVLDHIARVDRVLTMPGGSLLMAGTSGVGRRTAVTLVAYLHQIELFTPKVGRGYSVKQFKADLKNVSCLLNIDTFALLRQRELFICSSAVLQPLVMYVDRCYLDVVVVVDVVTLAT